MTPRLVAQNGPDDGREYSIDQADLSLGRHPDCDVSVLWDLSVSRKHARIIGHMGLFWLEDLGSSNGTFLKSADGEERELVQNRPVLLLDGAQLRLGSFARFVVAGVVATSDRAVQLLNHMLSAVLAGAKYLPPEIQERQRELCHSFQRHLLEANDEDELLRLVAQGIPTLSGDERDPDVGAGPLEPPSGDELAPLAPDLPRPGDRRRLKSIQNVFDENIGACFPGVEDQEESTDDE